MRVLIIGGGPAGSTLGAFLKRYRPATEAIILEREKFPRDHIGESQLPRVCDVLHELGVWDKVEAAGFPIKIGATYKWGTTDELWDFEFLPGETFAYEERPAKFRGQRTRTAFQVDRSIYDKILLDHARELGVDVREETKVQEVLHEGDRITGLKLANGDVLTADYYVDCSGHAGILRRTLGVEVDLMTSLQNVAFWDYWQNAEWAVEIGVGGTRIQIMSVGYGWIWFIPLGPTRTSCGLVVPADYYKKTGKKPEELYLEAVTSEPRISSLLKSATREHKFTTTKDWSFLSTRLVGENWFLCGECAGFADPILSAGLTLAQTGARQLAYVLIGMERNPADRDWLTSYYDETQKQRITQHIRFADFWYTANVRFTELREFVSKIAADAGISKNANDAFQWLGTGGFMNDGLDVPSFVDGTIGSLKQLTQRFTESQADWIIGKNNVYKLDLEGAETVTVPVMENGRITRESCYRRNGLILPRFGLYKMVTDLLKSEFRSPVLFSRLYRTFLAGPEDADMMMGIAYQMLETMAAEGWIKCSYNPNVAMTPLSTPDESGGIRSNRDEELFGARPSAS